MCARRFRSSSFDVYDSDIPPRAVNRKSAGHMPCIRLPCYVQQFHQRLTVLTQDIRELKVSFRAEPVRHEIRIDYLLDFIEDDDFLPGFDLQQRFFHLGRLTDRVLSAVRSIADKSLLSEAAVLGAKSACRRCRNALSLAPAPGLCQWGWRYGFSKRGRASGPERRAGF